MWSEPKRVEQAPRHRRDTQSGARTRGSVLITRSEKLRWPCQEGYKRYAIFSREAATSASAKENSLVPVDIAFITVNYNTLEYVSQLTSFFNSLDVPFTLSFTVVDNDSRDGSQDFLQSHPEINYLPTKGNIGYGRAVNR